MWLGVEVIVFDQIENGNSIHCHALCAWFIFNGVPTITKTQGVAKKNCSCHICGLVEIEFAGNTIQLWIAASSQLPALLMLCLFFLFLFTFLILLLWQIYNRNGGDIVPTHGNGKSKWRPRKIRISFDCSKSRILRLRRSFTARGSSMRFTLSLLFFHK